MSKREDDNYEVDQLRVRNRLQARRIKKLQAGIDETFYALCEVGTAQAALYEIWEASDLECDPQDYDIIVEYATKAIAAYRVSLVSEETEF